MTLCPGEQFRGKLFKELVSRDGYLLMHYSISRSACEWYHCKGHGLDLYIYCFQVDLLTFLRNKQKWQKIPAGTSEEAFDIYPQRLKIVLQWLSRRTQKFTYLFLLGVMVYFSVSGLQGSPDGSGSLSSKLGIRISVKKCKVCQLHGFWIRIRNRIKRQL